MEGLTDPGGFNHKGAFGVNSEVNLSISNSDFYSHA